jgi:1,4-alpha-glucan branching enzyme
MYGHPGKKLLFMGCEFAQWEEWNQSKSLDWHLAEFDRHKGVSQTIKKLNALYTKHTALHQVDNSWEGFEWIDLHNRDQSILSFIRYNAARDEHVACLFNFTPNTHTKYKMGVPEKGTYYEILNTDDSSFFGSGVVNPKGIKAKKGECHGRAQYIEINVPPLAGVFFKLGK